MVFVCLCVLCEECVVCLCVLLFGKGCAEFSWLYSPSFWDAQCLWVFRQELLVLEGSLVGASVWEALVCLCLRCLPQYLSLHCV